MSDATPTPETPEPAAPAAPETPAVAPQDPEWLPARLDRAKRSAVQDTLKALGVDDLESARKAIEDANRIKAEQMSEAERAQKAAEELAAKNAELEAALKERDLRDLRNKVASATGLPEVLAAKLAEGDEEAMTAEAKAILAAMPAVSQGLPDAAGTVPSKDPAEADPFVEGMLSKAKTR